MKVIRLKQKSCALIASLCLISLSGQALALDASQKVSPPVAGAVDALTIRKAFKLDKDPLISLVEQDAKVEYILRGLARKANLNLIYMVDKDSKAISAVVASAPVAEEDSALADLAALTGDSVSAPVVISAGSGPALRIPYLELKDVPLSEAFALVLQMSGLSGRRVYNSLMIATPQQMQEMGFASPIIKTYPIYNQSATALVQKGISQGAAAATTTSPILEQLRKIYISRGVKPAPELMLDERTSTLIVIGTQEAIDIADQLIPVLDRALPQVMVEIKLIELTERGSQQLGATYGFGQNKVGAGFNNGNLEGRGPGNPLTGPGEGAITFSSLENFTPNFNVRLNALINNSQARVLTNPRLTIQHGIKALFNSTTQFPILSTTVTSTTSTQTISTLDIGEILEITPFIDTEKGMITMKLVPNISTRGNLVAVSGQAVPEINKRSIETTLRVKDGESVIIGGLMRKADTQDKSKIPLLGDIPFLGNLFSTSTSTSENVEVVIMVTPHILAAQ